MKKNILDIKTYPVNIKTNSHWFPVLNPLHEGHNQSTVISVAQNVVWLLQTYIELRIFPLQP